jgi:hypothetical protein
MAQIITKIQNTKILTQLDTYNHTTTLASMYTVQCDMSELPPSGLIITIQQNGSTQATSVVPASNQSHTSLRVQLNCALNDVISVILSSAVTSDSNLNVVKGILKIQPGLI